MQQTDVREWWQGIPPVTRWWLTAATGLALGSKLGLNPFLFTVDWQRTWSSFQIWRPVTAFTFFGFPSFNVLFQLYMLYNFGSAVERSPFPSGGGSREGSMADYIFHLGVGGILILLVNWLIGFNIVDLGAPLLTFVIYLWSKKHPTAAARFFFFNVSGVYLPWVMVLFSFFVDREPPFKELMGIGAAHVLYMALEILPQNGWPRLYTPRFISNAFRLQPTDDAAAVMRLRVGAGRPAAQAPPAARWFQGRGNVLGGGDVARPHRD